jgi:PAS domain S-box-containing protein
MNSVDNQLDQQAHARLAAIIDSSDDAIVGKDLNGIVTSWNPAAERLFGYTAAEAIGRSITMIIPKERLDEEATVLARIRRGDRVDHFETVRRRKDGSSIDISLTVSPIVDSTGRVVGASKIARDISDRKAAEAARIEEERIRETLAHIGATLAAELDREKLLQTATEAAMSLVTSDFAAFVQAPDRPGSPFGVVTVCGESPEAVTGFAQNAAPALIEPFLRGAGPIRVQNIATDRRWSEAGRGVSYQGLSVCSCLAVPVISPAGVVLGGFVFGHSRPDAFLARHEHLAVGIASWAALALDNARLYQDAQQANRVKDDFLATLSHELRTPLNAMLGWSQLLRSGTLPPETQRRALDAIERNTRAQAQLVEDLLDVSRIVSGKLQVKLEHVDLTTVITDAVDSIRPTAAAKKLTVLFTLDPVSHVVVMGDADRLRQIATNLLSNAMKFTPAGGQILVDLRRTTNAHVELIVRDTGQGIAPGFLEHAFERFRQADIAKSRKHGGLGLGLAIVRSLTEAHRGTVSADSPGEGKGATFTVTLPVHSIRTETGTVAVSRASGTALSGVHVLVAEDQIDARELLRVVLELEGATVSDVGTSQEALEVLTREHVDVLLADIGLPDQDGYALIRAIRGLDPTQGSDVPAIAATAYASARERERALAAGYGWHLAKPLDPEQVVAAVLAALKNQTR